MTEGFVSDVKGDDTVMDKPHVTITFDASKLDDQQAVTLAQHGSIREEDEFTLGGIVAGDEAASASSMGEIEFHLPVSAGLIALVSTGVLDDTEQRQTEHDGE